MIYTRERQRNELLEAERKRKELEEEESISKQIRLIGNFTNRFIENSQPLPEIDFQKELLFTSENFFGMEMQIKERPISRIIRNIVSIPDSEKRRDTIFRLSQLFVKNKNNLTMADISVCIEQLTQGSRDYHLFRINVIWYRWLRDIYNILHTHLYIRELNDIVLSYIFNYFEKIIQPYRSTISYDEFDIKPKKKKQTTSNRVPTKSELMNAFSEEKNKNKKAIPKKRISF